MQNKKTSASPADLQQSTIGFTAMCFPVRNSIMAQALIRCCGFREKLWQKTWHGAERSTSQWRRMYAPPSPHVNLLDFLLQFADELNIPHSPSFVSETERNSNSKSNMPFFSWRPQWARGNKNGKNISAKVVSVEFDLYVQDFRAMRVFHAFPAERIKFFWEEMFLPRETTPKLRNQKFST
jgi:hypothetical protein